MLSLGLPNQVVAAEATYKQVRRCRTVPGSDATTKYYGWVSAAGQTIHLSRNFEATGPTQKCAYVTDYSEREITKPSRFN